MIGKFLEISILAALIGLGNFFINPSRPSIVPEIEFSPSMFSEGWIIVDARSSEEFSKDHAAGAVNLDEGEFDSQISYFLEMWDPTVKVGVYCNPKNCNSSMAVAKRLKKDYGLEHVYVLKGDWRKWKK